MIRIYSNSLPRSLSLWHAAATQPKIKIKKLKMKWLARAASALREAAEPVMILAGNQLANGHSKKMQGQNVISCYAIVIAMKKVPIFANEVRFPPVYVHQIDL